MVRIKRVQPGTPQIAYDHGDGAPGKAEGSERRWGRPVAKSFGTQAPMYPKKKKKKGVTPIEPKRRFERFPADGARFPGMYPRDGQLEPVENLLSSGLSIRAVSRFTGVHTQTVKKVLKFLLKERDSLNLGPILCPCGKVSTHRGWCRVRYSNSPARQRFMRRWHSRRRKELASLP